MNGPLESVDARPTFPYPLGKSHTSWKLAFMVSLLLLGLSVFAYSRQLQFGEIVTGMRGVAHGGAAWGLYIAFVVYFIGLSFAGINIAALTRLFQIQALYPLTRLAELLTIAALPMGALCVMADLGRPLQGLLFLPRYARPMSPFFGTFTLVIAGYLFASLVYCWLGGRADASLCAEKGPRRPHWIYRLWAMGCRRTAREADRHRRVGFWMALFILPLLIVATSTLGFVFGIQGGRPGWFSALQAPGFVVLAGCSGSAMLFILAVVIRHHLDLQEIIGLDALRFLANFQWILVLVYVYFMAVEELTANYAAGRADSHLAHEMVWGAYAPVFWSVLVCFLLALLIGFLQFAAKAFSIAWSVTAAVLINIAAILRRFLIVVPSQTHGNLLPYGEGQYLPNWVEIAVILGLFALATLLILIFIRYFPIVPIASYGNKPLPAVRESRRKMAFALTLLLGSGFAVTGFLFSLRLGTLPFLDPILPYSPVIFILGIMIVFYSPAVYETLPESKHANRPA